MSAGVKLQVDIANLSVADKRFISGVLRVFTDPQYSALADALRKSAVALHYDHRDGCCCFTDLSKVNPGPN